MTRGIALRAAAASAGSTSRWAVRLALATSLIAVVLLVNAPAGHSDCGAAANPIVAENCKAGTSGWEIAGDIDAIQGFTTDISVNRGSTVAFKVDNKTPGTYRLDIYRMGYYGGAGARLVGSVTPSSFARQPDCSGPQAGTGLVDCDNWGVTASWAVPSDAVSGIYFAAAVPTGAGSPVSHIVFVVRDDASDSDLYYQTSDTTWQAYNRYGGNSLYTGGPLQNPGRAAKVSYNRPFTTRNDTPEDWVFNAEYPMVRWLERNGYDVSYETGVDSDRFGSLIRNHKVFISSGHDEYWAGQQRANVEAARDAGVNLAFFSGNEVFWKTRWEDNHRTLVSYKETHANAKIDPTATWTGTWMDSRPFNPDGPKPQNALTGTLFTVTQGTHAIQVPAEYGRLRFWRNTGVASLGAGQTATLGDDTLGYEWDSDVDNGARPPGLFDLSFGTFSGQVLEDNGSNYSFADATHSLTMYRAASGALVFGAGTVQWAWGLDSHHDNGSGAADPNMEQATVNLLADMHAQPATLQSGLTPATASTDTIAPQSSITSPAPGTHVVAGQQVTIAGTADDAGGGHVAGVEVSVDGGATWHPAVGRENWVYVWTPSASGTPTILSRAVDDSGNIGPRPPDSTPPTIASLVPADGASGVDPATDVSARFDEALAPSTVTGGSLTLRDAAGAAVPADVAYDEVSRTIVLRPKAPLARAARYSATVKAGVTDTAGNPLGADRTWSFTTAAQPGSAGTPSSAAASGGTTSAANATGKARVTLTPRTVRASKAGTVKLRVACRRGTSSCRVALRLELAGRAVATKSATVPAGAARTLTLTLSRTARRTLARKRTLRVSAVAVVAGTTTRTSVLVLAPRKP